MIGNRIEAALRITILSAIAVSGYSQTVTTLAEAAYGTVPGHRYINAQNEISFAADPGYPPGVYAVPLNVKQTLAFDTDGAETGICTRIDDKPFELPNGNIKYYRFQCERSLNGRDTLFVGSTEFLPTSGEKLEWKPLDGESPLPWSSGEKPADLHRYAAVASPKLLIGSVLVSAVWFSGEYPPKKERDELRDEQMAFGHYKLLDRALFIGKSAKQPDTFLYKTSEPTEVREGLEWSFLPEDSSEKTRAHVAAIYEIRSGYILRVSQLHDHEGFGEDDTTDLYIYEAGQWRLLATAETTKLY